MGYPDRVRQARVFPGPPGSRPARSLIYTHGGDLYKATIGRPRRRYGPPPARSTVAGRRAEGQESGSTNHKAADTARRVNAQLIVLAGRGSISMLLGTVNQYVLRRAPCPVLVVPEGQEQQARA